MPICPQCGKKFVYHKDTASEEEAIENEKTIELWKRMILQKKRSPFVALGFIIWIIFTLFSPASLPRSSRDVFWDGFQIGISTAGFILVVYQYFKIRKQLKEAIPILQKQGFDI